MRSAADRTQFDVGTFKKLMRLLDSPIEGERNAALNLARKLCAQHRPPLLLFEAAALAFGAASGEYDEAVDKAARLQVEVDNLTNRLERREAEMAQMADRIEQLVANAKKKVEGGAHNFGMLLDDLWALPQIRLLLMTLVMSVQAIVDWQFEVSLNFILLFLFNVMFWAIELRLFVKWTSLQFRQDGLLQLLIKWAVFGSGVYACFCVGSMDGSRATTLAGALIVRAAFSALTVSRLSEWLVEDVGMKLWESQPVQILRRCF
jgi:hypothetical protein